MSVSLLVAFGRTWPVLRYTHFVRADVQRVLAVAHPLGALGRDLPCRRVLSLAALPVPVGEVGELGCADIAADGRVVCRSRIIV